VESGVDPVNNLPRIAVEISNDPGCSLCPQGFDRLLTGNPQSVFHRKVAPALDIPDLSTDFGLLIT